DARRHRDRTEAIDCPHPVRRRGREEEQGGEGGERERDGRADGSVRRLWGHGLGAGRRWGSAAPSCPMLRAVPPYVPWVIAASGCGRTEHTPRGDGASSSTRGGR